MTAYNTLIAAEQTCHTIEIREKATGKTGVANSVRSDGNTVRGDANSNADKVAVSTAPTTGATTRSSPPRSLTAILRSRRRLKGKAAHQPHQHPALNAQPISGWVNTTAHHPKW